MVSNSKAATTHVGSVSSEGGPLILLDAQVVRGWSGIDGADYERASSLLDRAPDALGGEISVGSSSGVLWQPSAGTIDVFRVGDGFALVRWLGPGEPSASLLGLPATRQEILGRLRLADRLVVLWAAENGGDIDGLPVPQPGPARGALAVEGSGLIAACSPGLFEVTHEAFSDATGRGTRCWIRRLRSGADHAADS